MPNLALGSSLLQAVEPIGNYVKRLNTPMISITMHLAARMHDGINASKLLVGDKLPGSTVCDAIVTRTGLDQSEACLGPRCIRTRALSTTRMRLGLRLFVVQDNHHLNTGLLRRHR